MGKRGPLAIKINWKTFDKLASYQCTQLEIADFFGVNISTLENACERDFGMKLSVLWDQKKGLGRTKLKKIQWKLAENSPGMAIFLGKNLLGQTDDPIDTEIIGAIQQTGMSKDYALKLIHGHAETVRIETKKTYAEFVQAAGYPPPFPKQIEMYEFGINLVDPRLILGARGYGKTDYVVILGIAYDIYLDPLGSTNLIITKSKERNSAMLSEIANACKANGVVFSQESSTRLRAAGMKGKDHSVSAVTIKGVTMRGRHPKRTVFDDPVTEDDTSEKTRERVVKVYNEAMKLVSNVLLIGQPAHKFDLYAKLRKLVKTMEVPHGSIAELDHDLEAQRLAGVDEASIQASYFLKILDEGATPFDKIKYVDKYPDGDSVCFIDPSDGGDYTAVAIVKKHFDGVAVQGHCWKKAWYHCVEDLIPILIKRKVRKLCFETNSTGSQPILQLRELLAKYNVGVVGVHSDTNKHAVIMAAGSYAHLIHLSRESDPTYTKLVVEYEDGAKFDDPPDSLARCLEWIGLIRGKK